MQGCCCGRYCWPCYLAWRGPWPAGAKFSPQFAGTQVPSFEEALALARGKIGVYVDSKDVTPADLAAALTKAGMLHAVVVYGAPGFLRKLEGLVPDVKIMPEAGSAATLERLLAEMKPGVVAFDAGGGPSGLRRQTLRLGGRSRTRGRRHSDRPPGRAG